MDTIQTVLFFIFKEIELKNDIKYFSGNNET